jgi:very-short-patch-repair endonuclease
VVKIATFAKPETVIHKRLAKNDKPTVKINDIEMTNNIILSTVSDLPGILSFWGFVIFIIIIVKIIKGIDGGENRKLEKKFNENLLNQNYQRSQISLKLPTTSPKTFPILRFVQQRHFKQAEYYDDYFESQIGKSEKILHSKLVEYFDSSKIHWNSKQIGNKIPDFIYEDKIKNVYIAIEIDEPYIYKTRTPLHFYGNEADSKKESIYKSNGWTLIRFSEAQVVNYSNCQNNLLYYLLDHQKVKVVS